MIRGVQVQKGQLGETESRRESLSRKGDSAHVGRAYLEPVCTSSVVSNLSEELTEALYRLKSAYQSHEQLMRGLRHDLGSPLASIASMADTLQAEDLGALNAEQCEACGMIAVRARQLIDRTAAFADIFSESNRRPDVAQSTCDVGVVVKDIYALYVAVAAQRSLTLECELHCDELLVSCRSDSVQRIISNLLDNAMNYTHKGNVSVRLERHGAWCEITVSDTGEGISPEECQCIFDEYTRGSHYSDHPGSGMGLAIVNRLVEVAGGSILVESTVGVGSTFVVKLPLAETDD